MNRDDFTITITFADGAVVQIGGADEFFVTTENSDGSAVLDNDRLRLIELVQKAEADAAS